jgi:hypothetical protein
MNPAVADLAADSGPLVKVMGVAGPAGSYRALEFEFASGVLSMSCDDDTDQIIVAVGCVGIQTEPVTDSWARELIGKSIDYAWDLRNHRGYNDGFQLRLMDDDRREEARQFEVAGSVIDARRVVPGSATA